MTDRKRWDKIFSLMEREMIVATGCTEPAAVAYAAAAARAIASGTLKLIKIRASINIFKNAMAAGIPGTKLAGMEYAATLGVLFGNPQDKLQVLSSLNEGAEKAACEFVKSGCVQILPTVNDKTLYVEVIVETDTAWGRAIIESRHDSITLLENNEGVQFLGLPQDSDGEASADDDISITIDEILEFAETVDLSELSIIHQAIELNCSISDEGLRIGQGLGVGMMIKQQIQAGLLADDVMNYAMACTAAGTDARMAGSIHSVMSNSGSGNQGLSATLPVVAVWEKLGQSEERLIRAVTMSNLITIYAKLEFGKLSALCGVVLAVTGSACGITWLLGGAAEHIKLAINNVIGNVSGIICDGAKSSCALKVSTCTAAAVQSALLAERGKSIPSIEGIVGVTAEDSIKNLARLGTEASPKFDPLIIDIMINK
jgi:L-cysteine desulfidase